MYEHVYIWEIGILNQLLLRNPYTQIEFSEKQCSRWQKSNSLGWVHFLLPIQFVLALAFDRTVLYGNFTLSFVVL